MGKKKPEVDLYSYGIYSTWSKDSKSIPTLLEITTTIPCQLDVEFGYVLKIKKAKGYKINLEIHHPPIMGEDGSLMPVFESELFITSNDFEYFQGDCVFAPIEEKAGKWTLVTFIEGKEVARKEFVVVF